RNIGWHHKGDEHSGDEESLVDRVFPKDGEGEFDSKSHRIRNDDDWHHLHQANPDLFPKGRFNTGSEEMLIAHVVYPEEQAGQHGNDHRDHKPFHVDGLAHLRTLCRRYTVRREQESLKSFKPVVEFVILPSLFEVVLDAI